MRRQPTPPPRTTLARELDALVTACQLRARAEPALDLPDALERVLAALSADEHASVLDSTVAALLTDVTEPERSGLEEEMRAAHEATPLRPLADAVTALDPTLPVPALLEAVETTMAHGHLGLVWLVVNRVHAEVPEGPNPGELLTTGFPTLRECVRSYDAEVASRAAFSTWASAHLREALRAL